MRIHPRIVSLALLALAAAGGAEAQGRRQVPLVMPPGWDDAFFARLEQGRTPKTVVAVMNFTGGELLEQRLRFRMSDALVTSLVQAGRFDVVERDRLDLVLQEQNLTVAGRVDPATAARVGKILGAELVVYGLVTGAAEQKIDKFSYDLVHVEVSMDVRAVNATSGQVVISQSARGTAEAKVITTADGTVVSGPTNYDPLYLDATRTALDSAARLVATAVPLVGTVVSADNGGVMIDAGESRGVAAGAVFIVFRKGEPILHPSTHERIGWQKTVLAALEVTSTENDLSTGRILRTATRDTKIQPGDLVILRP